MLFRLGLNCKQNISDILIVMATKYTCVDMRLISQVPTEKFWADYIEYSLNLDPYILIFCLNELEAILRYWLGFKPHLNNRYKRFVYDLRVTKTGQIYFILAGYLLLLLLYQC